MKLILASVLALVAAGEAGAITVPTRANLTTNLVGSSFSGVGLINDFAPGEAVHGGGYCGASLVGANIIVTAAHCIDTNVQQKFVLRDGNGFTAYSMGDFSIAPNYATGGGTDLAVVRLDRRVADSHDIYELFTGNDDIGAEFTMVGAGLTGTTDVGIDFALGDGQLRYGVNRYDLTASAFTDAYNAYFGRGPENRPTNDILFYDIDDGTAQHDVFGRFIGIPDRGIFADGVLKESGIAPGDSGGPDFINGKLSGIHSFGFTGSVFQNDICGAANSVDVAATDGLGCGNSSIGDIGASVRVSYYADFIKDFIRLNAIPDPRLSAVPEPSTWLTMTFGFLGLGCAMRRKRAGALRAKLA